MVPSLQILGHRISTRGRSWMRCAVLLLGVLLLGSCGQAGESQPHEARTLLTDTEGEITHGLLQLIDDSAPEFLQTQAALIAATPREVHFRVSYGSARTRAAFLEELRRKGVHTAERVTLIRTGGSHYPWVRDLFVAGTDASGGPIAYLHNPVHLGSINGAPTHADAIGMLKALGAGRLIPTPLRVEGGSVVADSERVFLSRDYASMPVRLGQYEDTAAFRDDVAKCWGRRVTLISTTGADSANHLDLLMMPVGGHRVLVGNPARALELIAAMPKSEIRSFTRDAHDMARRVSPQDMLRNILPFDVLGRLAEEAQEPRRVAAFEKLRRELAAAGYEVIDVPFLSLDPKHTGARVVLSYTNVLQDTRRGARTVYMPTYRLPTFDDSAARAWARCGFRVIRVDSFGPGLNGGALRCLSQVIRRAARPASHSGPLPDQDRRP